MINDDENDDDDKAAAEPRPKKHKSSFKCINFHHLLGKITKLRFPDIFFGKVNCAGGNCTLPSYESAKLTFLKYQSNNFSKFCRYYLRIHFVIIMKSSVYFSQR